MYGLMTTPMGNLPTDPASEIFLWLALQGVYPPGYGLGGSINGEYIAEG